MWRRWNLGDERVGTRMATLSGEEGGGVGEKDGRKVPRKGRPSNPSNPSNPSQGWNKIQKKKKTEEGRHTASIGRGRGITLVAPGSVRARRGGRASLDGRDNLPDMLATQCLWGFGTLRPPGHRHRRRRPAIVDGRAPTGGRGRRRRCGCRPGSPPRGPRRPTAAGTSGAGSLAHPPPTHSGRVATKWGPNATGFVGIPADGNFPPKIG